MDHAGVAPLMVAVVVVASLSASVAAPVAVDTVNVDPDHPLYVLERLGERIRGANPTDLMMERWTEYKRLVDRGKGLKYKHILDDFVHEMRKVAPGDVEPKMKIVQWMQEQMPGIGLVQLKLCEDVLSKCKEALADVPEVSKMLENEIEALEELEKTSITPEIIENVRSRLTLIREWIDEVRKGYAKRLPAVVSKYFDIDNVFVNVTANIEAEINMERVPTFNFEEELEEFEELLAEVNAMLEGAPAEVPGKRAAERLVAKAVELRDRAVEAYRENVGRKAFGLLQAGEMHLRNAKLILEKANEWEWKSEVRGTWVQWKEKWADLKEELKEGELWEDIKKHWEQYAESVKQLWEEKWYEVLEGTENLASVQEVSENVTLEEILANPGAYVHKRVTVQGRIEKETTIFGRTLYYLVSGGNRILLSGQELSPYVDKEVTVSGEVEISVGYGVGISIEVTTVVEVTH